MSARTVAKRADLPCRPAPLSRLLILPATISRQTTNSVQQRRLICSSSRFDIRQFAVESADLRDRTHSMFSLRKPLDRKRSRRGTTVVETALVLPVFLLFVLGLIELAHAQMVKNVLRSACRQAARMGSTENNTTDEVRAHLLDVLDSAVDVSAVEVFVKDASSFDDGDATSVGSELEAMPDIELADAEPRSLFMVRATVHYEDIAIVPNIPYLGGFLDEVTLEGQAFMRHE
jgi:TadE-like protein